MFSGDHGGEKVIFGYTFTTPSSSLTNSFICSETWGPIGQTPRLYVGGEFSHIGGIAANNIAAWDGVQWTALDGGCDGPVHAFIIYNGSLIAGGGFISPGVRIAAWNGGSHVGPTFAGDTLRAFTEVVEKAEVPTRRDVGALRLRLNAVKNVSADELPSIASLLSGTKEPRIVLELDYWALLPRKA